MIDAFTLILVVLRRPRFYHCSVAYESLPLFLRRRKDWTQWVHWRLWRISPGFSCKMWTWCDQGKGSWVNGLAIFAPFDPLFPFGTPLWATGLISALISVILRLLTFCPLSYYMCPMKPNSKTGCNLLQFFSKYDRGLQVQKQVLFGMNADPLLPPPPKSLTWKIHTGNLC